LFRWTQDLTDLFGTTMTHKMRGQLPSTHLSMRKLWKCRGMTNRILAPMDNWKLNVSNNLRGVRHPNDLFSGNPVSDDLYYRERASYVVMFIISSTQLGTLTGTDVSHDAGYLPCECLIHSKTRTAWRVVDTEKLHDHVTTSSLPTGSANNSLMKTLVMSGLAVENSVLAGL